MKQTKKQPAKPINKKVKKSVKPKPVKPADEKMGDVKKLVHLLQVHQIELEHQNHELRITQEELEVSRNKYVNLFDFAPIPYFTLDQHGIIKEVNLSASKMFGVDRSKLIGKSFITYVPMNEKGEITATGRAYAALLNDPSQKSDINADARVDLHGVHRAQRHQRLAQEQPHQRK